MPPARARAPVDDTKAEARERLAPATTAAAGTTRPRKAAANGASLTSNTNKEPVPASSTAQMSRTVTNGSQPTTGVPGISWTAEDTSLLHAYRNAYGLSTSPSFHSLLGAAVLAAPGIGRHSPTMARQRDKRKVPKEQLALAVRKHFNGLAVNETDVVVDFLYAVKMQERGFKMRFAPKKSR